MTSDGRRPVLPLAAVARPVTFLVAFRAALPALVAALALPVTFLVALRVARPAFVAGVDRPVTFFVALRVALFALVVAPFALGRRFASWRDRLVDVAAIGLPPGRLIMRRAERSRRDVRRVAP